MVVGDLRQPSTLDAAFATASALVLISVPDTVTEVVACAETAGIEHIVVVSSAAVTAGYDTTYNLPVQLAVRASDFLFGFESYDGVPGVTDEPPVPSDDPYDTLAEVTGRPGRSYGQWARDHAADFV